MAFLETVLLSSCRLEQHQSADSKKDVSQHPITVLHPLRPGLRQVRRWMVENAPATHPLVSESPPSLTSAVVFPSSPDMPRLLMPSKRSSKDVTFQQKLLLCTYFLPPSIKQNVETQMAVDRWSFPVERESLQAATSTSDLGAKSCQSLRLIPNQAVFTYDNSTLDLGAM